MQSVVRALVRSRLDFFIRKAFATICPGVPYSHNWHIHAIIHELQNVSAGDCRRLIINQPPRSLKSITVSVAYVAWLLGHDPTRRIMVVSYSNELSAELHRQFRMVVDSEWYQAMFPRMQIEKDTNGELVTTMGGGRFAASVGGSLTGRGADLIIIDDPVKADDALSDVARNRANDWFKTTLISRLNDKSKGAIIVVMQRLHEDDLSGHLLENPEWRHLNLPAIAEQDCRIQVGPNRWLQRNAGDLLHSERESRPVLDAIKAEMGSLRFSAQYQQSPIPTEGNLVKRDWFRKYDTIPAKVRSVRVVQSWDTALATGLSNDFSVCTTWLMKGSDYYLLDVFRKRLPYPELKRAVKTMAARFHADTILIEEAGAGMSVLQDLRSESKVARPIGVKPLGSKADRMLVQSAKIEGGQVHLPREADWLAPFLFELLAFPNGRHDDQVDSVSQFLKWAADRNWQQNDIGMPISVGGGVRWNSL